jgi:hypothetical protein
MVNKSRIEEDMEESDRGLFQGIIPVFARRD